MGNKREKKAYRKGRREGFDRGFKVAQMVYEVMLMDLRKQLEELNSELILGEEEAEDDDGT